MRHKALFFIIFAIIITGKSLPAQVELLGELTPKEILQKIPEWKPHVDAYSPSLDIISKLQKVNEEVRIEIFLGTWCPDCRQHVSAYFKIMSMVQNPLIRTTYTGVPRDREARTKYIQGKDIQRIPTFIVFFRNQEIGRLIETPQKSVEEDLWTILEGKIGGR
jgi:thiol-disulfide isomerase/thioredoxin